MVCAAFVAVAILAGLGTIFYAWNAVEIFTTEKRDLPWWVHQGWLNGLGAFVGWIAVWVLVRKYAWRIFSLHPGEMVPNGWDAVLAVVGFAGVTGYLPMAVVGAVQSIALLVDKAARYFFERMAGPSGRSDPPAGSA